MDAKAFTALLVGIITALIALIGYWNTHYLQRRDRRALMYAEAVAAMRTYEQAPYLVRRRADSSGATRAAIAAQLIDANTRVSYNQKLLLMDSLPVGIAYGLLLKVTQARLSRYRDEDWRTAVIQRELTLWGRAGRRDTLRECADLVDVRVRK